MSTERLLKRLFIKSQNKGGVYVFVASPVNMQHVFDVMMPSVIEVMGERQYIKSRSVIRSYYIESFDYKISRIIFTTPELIYHAMVGEPLKGIAFDPALDDYAFRETTKENLIKFRNRHKDIIIEDYK